MLLLQLQYFCYKQSFVFTVVIFLWPTLILVSLYKLFSYDAYIFAINNHQPFLSCDFLSIICVFVLLFYLFLYFLCLLFFFYILFVSRNQSRKEVQVFVSCLSKWFCCTGYPVSSHNNLSLNEMPAWINQKSVHNF